MSSARAREQEFLRELTRVFNENSCKNTVSRTIFLHSPVLGSTCKKLQLKLQPLIINNPGPTQVSALASP